MATLCFTQTKSAI